MKRFLIFFGILVVCFAILFFVNPLRRFLPGNASDAAVTWDEWVKENTSAGVTVQKTADTGTAEMDPKWEKWIDKQTAIIYNGSSERFKAPDMQSALEELYMTQEVFEAKVRSALRAQVAAKARELQQEYPEPPKEQVKYSIHFEADLGRVPSPKHEGPQTPEALMESFDEKYSRGAYASQLDEKYPRSEWLQMYVDNGWVLKDYNAYKAALGHRWDVERAENNPEQWTSGLLNIPPTDDWETYKTAFIERIAGMSLRAHAAMDADHSVTGGYTPYSRPDVFLPFKDDLVYVRRNGLATSYYGIELTDKQHFNLTHRGIEPEGLDIVYIDNDYNVLTERPPIITREMVTELPFPPDDWQPPRGWVPPQGLEEALREQGWTGSFNLPDDIPQGIVDPPHDFVDSGVPTPEKYAKEALEDAQRSQENAQRTVETLMEMSDAEFEAELEKLLIEGMPEHPTAETVENVFSEQFDRERFSPERLNRAMETLKRYGPEEGLRRLRKDDPEIAEEFKRTLPSQESPAAD